MFASLARRFGKDCAALVEAAQVELQQGNRTAVAREMHTLKGLAATLGATALARQAAELEATFEGAAQHQQRGSSACTTGIGYCGQ